MKQSDMGCFFIYKKRLTKGGYFLHNEIINFNANFYIRCGKKENDMKKLIYLY